MTGTFLNIATVLIGGMIGLLFGARIPDKLKSTVIAGMGLFTAAMGMQMFLNTENPLIVLGSLLIGTLLGEWWRIEDGLQNLGKYLEGRFSKADEDGSNRFVRGFLTASLLFCVGPMTILGSIYDGLNISGDYYLLTVKSVLDGFAAMALASTLGIGVLFSAIIIFLFQGGISFLAMQLGTVMTTAMNDPNQLAFINSMINELTATGGITLIALAISSLLEIKRIRVGSFLPALLVAPLIVWVLGLFQ
jgi:uncharacterized protein